MAQHTHTIYVTILLICVNVYSGTVKPSEERETLYICICIFGYIIICM